MLSLPQVRELEKQQYRMVGNHSAVKVCGWTKSMIRGKGGCYKFAFYGIRSHQCMQMTTSMFCANKCTFCWRGEKAPVSKTWYGPVDPPAQIINEALEKHLGLLDGFKGYPNASKTAVKQMKDIRHVALSLTGEPISYPLINEILEEFHKRRISTFLVTNAQFPEQIEKLKCVTQLYISVDAPSKAKLKEVDRPLFKDYYERMLKSLDVMAKKEFRTCIRLTIIKEVNDDDLEGYKQMIERGKPDFIEVKGYMHVGASRMFLERKNMPLHEDIRIWSKKFAELLPDYTIVGEHPQSRVVCFMRKAMPGQYIDFPKFLELAAKGHAKAEEYSSPKIMPNG